MRARPRHSPAFPLLADLDGEGEFVPPDHAAQVTQAHSTGYEEGLAAGRSEAEADAELRLSEMEIRHLEILAQERETFQRDCADVLAARFESAEKQIERAIENRVSDLLRPWLVDQIRARAIDDLEKAIARAMTDGAKVHIEAPPAIIAHLRDRFPAGGLQIGYSESETADIRAHVDDTAIEANISAWISTLEEASA